MEYDKIELGIKLRDCPFCHEPAHFYTFDEEAIFIGCEGAEMERVSNIYRPGKCVVRPVIFGKVENAHEIAKKWNGEIDNG